MKKKLFNILTIFLSIFVLIEIIIKKSIIYNSIAYALNVWVNSLIPSLFPFFIISDILINYNIVNYIPLFLKRICKYLFNITDNMLMILILSMISGFPSNARNTRTLYDMGLIDLDEANHILIFSHFSNPLFILTTVSVFFLECENMGSVLLISHYLSNFILGLLFRKRFYHNDIKKRYQLESNDFGSILILAIKRAIDTIMLICGIVCVFLVLSAIINNLFNFNSYNSMIIKGLFEITIGIEQLGMLDLSIIYKLVITSCFLAFGGLSVHMQVISQITGTKISYSYFFMGRIYQMIISGFITYMICLVMHI